MVRNQAVVVMAAKMKEASWGLGDKLRLAPTRLHAVAREAATIAPR